jgi:hypothetical protein
LATGNQLTHCRADILRRLGRIDEALGYLKKQADFFQSRQDYGLTLLKPGN